MNCDSCLNVLNRFVLSFKELLMVFKLYFMSLVKGNSIGIVATPISTAHLMMIIELNVNT